MSVATSVFAVGEIDYAFGMEWHSPGRNTNVRALCAQEAARSNANLAVVDVGQYGLGWVEGYRAGRRRCFSAALAVSAALETTTVFGAFALDAGVYVVARVKGLVLSDGDKVFADETEAREFFARYSHTPEWPTAVKLAPSTWDVPGATEVALDDVLSSQTAVRASRTPAVGRPPIRREILWVAGAVVIGAAVVVLALVVGPGHKAVASTRQVYEPLPAELATLSEGVAACLDGVMALYQVANVPGWPIVRWDCDGTTVRGRLERKPLAPRTWGTAWPTEVVPQNDLETAEASVPVPSPAPSRPLTTDKLLTAADTAFRLRSVIGTLKGTVEMATTPPRPMGRGEPPSGAPPWLRVVWTVKTTAPPEFWATALALPGTALGTLKKEAAAMVITGTTYVLQ